MTLMNKEGCMNKLALNAGVADELEWAGSPDAVASLAQEKIRCVACQVCASGGATSCRGRVK